MVENDEIKTKAGNKHGSTLSYAIGFIASLVLTIVPYYLVTEKIVMGTTLLFIILIFAVLQMFVQMFFFLHLGRGPKPLYNVVFFFATAGLIVLVVGASLIIMSNLYRNMSPEDYMIRLAQDENISQIDGKQTGACQENKQSNASHMVMVETGGANPSHIEAHRCDVLVFMSGDDAAHTLAFGTLNNPTSYGGLYEAAITSTHDKAITLNQIGDFSFYDKTARGTMGHFTVNP